MKGWVFLLCLFALPLTLAHSYERASAAGSFTDCHEHVLMSDFSSCVVSAGGSIAFVRSDSSSIPEDWDRSTVASSESLPCSSAIDIDFSDDSVAFVFGDTEKTYTVSPVLALAYFVVLVFIVCVILGLRCAKDVRVTTEVRSHFAKKRD